MALCTIATIGTERDLTVHLANLDRGDRSLETVATLLGILTSELLESLSLPVNAGFTRALFRDIYDRFDGVYPGAPIDDPSADPGTIPPRVVTGPDLVLLPEGLDDAGFAALQLVTMWRTNRDVLVQWTLPPRDFCVANTPAFKTQLKALIGTSNRRGLCLASKPTDIPTEPLDRLLQATAQLERATSDLEEARIATGKHRMALECARRVLVLCDFQWRARPAKGKDPEAALAGLRRLDDTILALDRAAMAAGPKSAREEKLAREVLACLLDGEAPIGDTLELMAMDPTAIGASRAEEMFEVLARAFAALSRSSLAELFVDAHLLPVFRDVLLLSDGERPEQPSLAAVLDEGTVQEWRDMSRAALDALKADKGSSYLGKIKEVGGYYKKALDVVQAGLNDATIPILLARISKAAGTPSQFQSVARSFAVCMLRGLFASGLVTHAGSPGTLLFNGKDVTSWFKVCARGLRRGEAFDAKELGEELRRLELGKNLKSTRVAGSANFVLSVVSVLLAADGTWERSWQSWEKLLLEALKTSEALAKLVYTFRVQTHVEGLLVPLEELGKRVGMLASFFAFAVTFGDTVERWNDRNTKYKFASGLSTVSAGIGVARVLPFVCAGSRLAKGLTAAGWLIMAVEFGYEMYLHSITPGTQGVFDEYRAAAMKGGAFDGASTRAERDAFMQAWEESRQADVFIKLRAPPRNPAGELGHVPIGGLPTWHLAYGLGFTSELVVKLFELDKDEEQDVTAAGIRKAEDPIDHDPSPWGTRARTGQPRGQRHEWPSG